MTGRTLVAIAWIVVLSCSCNAPRTDLTFTAPYSDLVNAQYRVASDDLFAYGIYGDRTTRTVSHTKLVPNPGLTGRDVASKTHIPKGTLLEGIQLAPPIELILSYGNDDGHGRLNPRIYEKVDVNKLH